MDDQTLVRQGIRSLLELTEDIRVVVEAADGEEALRVIERAAVDVVLLDVRMPRRSGLDVLRDLRGAGREVPTILLTTFSDEGVALEGVRAGARGFLLKDVSLEEVTQAVPHRGRGRHAGQCMPESPDSCFTRSPTTCFASPKSI